MLCVVAVVLLLCVVGQRRDLETTNHEFSLSRRKTYPQNYMADQQRLQISELHFDKFSTPGSKPKYVLVPVLFRMQCYGSMRGLRLL